LLNKVTVFRSYKTFLYDLLFLGQTHFPICPFHVHFVVLIYTHSEYVLCSIQY
jgi:hypothetical protein